MEPTLSLGKKLREWRWSNRWRDLAVDLEEFRRKSGLPIAARLKLRSKLPNNKIDNCGLFLKHSKTDKALQWNGSLSELLGGQSPKRNLDFPFCFPFPLPLPPARILRALD